MKASGNGIRVGLRLTAASLVVGIATVSVAVLPTQVADASPVLTPIVTTTTITTEGETPLSVPAESLLQVTVVGAAASTAQIGGGPPAGPGQGADVTAAIPGPVSASTLYAEVGGSNGGGGGGSSPFAATGGGASGLQTCSVAAPGCADTAIPSTDPRLIVAGGGGGGGEDYFNDGGAGGNAGITSAVTGPGAGGAGTDSGNGHNGSGAGLGDNATTAPAGAGSPGCGGSGGVGSPGSGGTGEGTVRTNGGGGGGGWVGGSGGGEGSCVGGLTGGGGGGGAGASFVESTAANVSITTAGSTAPEVIITVTSCPSIPGVVSHVLTATSRTGNFVGLFCVNAQGNGTYTQNNGSTGTATLAVVGTITRITASGKNLQLNGTIQGTTGTFTQIAPAPRKTGTFTLT